MPYGAVILEDPTTKRTWTVNGRRIKHYLGGDFERIITVVQMQKAWTITKTSNYKDVKEVLLGGNPVFFKLCLNLCYFNLMPYISKTYFWVFIHELCFWISNLFIRAIIAWPGDKPIFQEEDEDMVDPIDYLIEGDWAPRRMISSTMTFKNSWIYLYVYISFSIKIQHFITLFTYASLFWSIYACFDILLV